VANPSPRDQVHAPVEDIDVPVGLKVLVLTMIVTLMLMIILLVAVLVEIDLLQLLDGSAELFAVLVLA
jgi:hypothetical protein